MSRIRALYPTSLLNQKYFCYTSRSENLALSAKFRFEKINAGSKINAAPGVYFRKYGNRFYNFYCNEFEIVSAFEERILLVAKEEQDRSLFGARRIGLSRQSLPSSSQQWNDRHGFLTLREHTFSLFWRKMHGA